MAVHRFIRLSPGEFFPSDHPEGKLLCYNRSNSFPSQSGRYHSRAFLPGSCIGFRCLQRARESVFLSWDAWIGIRVCWLFPHTVSIWQSTWHIARSSAERPLWRIRSDSASSRYSHKWRFWHKALT